MSQQIDAARHLQNVTFKLSYPYSPFYPSTPVFAQFSGVLTGGGELHVKLDGGSIPDIPTSAGVPIRGTFSGGPNEPQISFSGLLCNNRIDGEVS